MSRSYTCVPSEFPVVLDFKQNLQQHHLAEADRQLLEQEVDLFISESPDEPGVYTEGDEDKLQMDYESLMLQLRIAIEDSFKKENQEMLRSAVATILQEEQRDRHWMELEEEQRPRWRPLRCRQIHDTLLKKVVEKRLQQVREVERGANDLSTSLKTEVCRMGKQIQRDLLLVVKEVQRCYSPDFDVCNMYAQLYHQAFSTRLMELDHTFLNVDCCIADVRTWLSNGLKKEVESWKNDKVPELIDGYFFSYLALDIINVGINHVDSFHTICKSHSMFDTNIVFDLLSQLHFEVMTEYVKRMLKRKLKLKDQDEQRAAARFLCEDSDRINTLFTNNGSKEKWLSSVLLRLAEVVRLQETDALQLEIATLARAYPDLSERHILALLQIKSNLSSSDVRSIKYSLTENKDALNSEPVPHFFSQVPLKRTFFASCVCN
uniref:Exocyst complex component 3 n=1 Tax=Electrophorus electricus TaxID=8005 RepID=A0AAY5F4Q8_ELEEL